MVFNRKARSHNIGKANKIQMFVMQCFIVQQTGLRSCIIGKLFKANILQYSCFKSLTNIYGFALMLLNCSIIVLNL